ncbi:NCS2 family permease [Lacticaseibacillus hulanensis]|uniref:NCS2 family permease n=1 Tax=Lacticaseibacillus hulanensis TaxID=2493111 RepID=UPI000FD883D6|nr:NCS2 family permease [Lacticaseibacillus hulanensis]
MDQFFQLKENHTTRGREVIAGLTTFFAMSYILFVAPQTLALTGMPSQAVFLATIIASATGTLIMGLFANVPYALGPGLGLNAFFTFTVVGAMGFTWQEALALVFVCGCINILITVTKIRKLIIMAIPEVMQHAISGGIGVFIAYIGLKNAGFLQFSANKSGLLSVNGGSAAAKVHGAVNSIVAGGGITPALVDFTRPGAIVALLGLLLMVVLVVRKVPGAVLIGIVATTIIGIPFGVTDLHMSAANSFGHAIGQLGTTFGAAFSAQGFGSLFTTPHRVVMSIMAIFAFSFADIFDTLGTFIGTGRRTGIFTEFDMNAMENGHGFSSKMDKALFGDAIATGVGSIFGTSNITVFVESATGIGAGGRTGLTAVVVAACFLVSSLLSPIIAIVPNEAVAPALILVGVMMMSSFREINWNDMSEAIPAFMASVVMGLIYNISYGIAAGFIFYCLVKTATGKAKEVHPVLWVVSALFILDFAVMAIV